MIKNVLITGGAGSLGKEFARYLKSQGKTVFLVDSNEWAVAELNGEFENVVLDDFSNVTAKNIDVVIHCAAYKHVNLGETNVSSFCNNNIYKLQKFFEAVRSEGAKILFISTDKAVEPISLYGATKMIGEYLAYEYGGSVARLGNILNSNGSVIPLWEKQIQEGLPLTITNPDMTRYVIEVSSAVRQIWSQFTEGKKLIVPDMGDPVPLLELANEVLAKHKLPLDYPKKVIGMRMGEKIHEKLYWPNEKL